MTERGIEARLASIQTQLDHIDRSLAGPPTMAERVVRLEEWRQSLAGVARKIEDGEQHDAVADAVSGERERARAELRRNIATIATIAGLVGSLAGSAVALVAGIVAAGGGV